MHAPRLARHARPLRRLAASLSLLLLSTACGLKGPLYMPPPPPPPDASLTTPPTHSAPPAQDAAAPEQ